MSTACRRPSDALLFETAFRSFFSVVATHILGGDLDTDLCLGHASLPRRAWWLARYFNPVNLAWRYYSMIAYRLSSGALGPARLAIINFEPFPYHPPLPYVIAELSVDDPMVRRLEISGLFSSQGILSVVAAYQGILAIQFTISTSGFGFLPNITKALAILGLFRVTVSHWIASKVYVEPFAYPYMHPNQESLNPVNPHPNSNPIPNLDNPYPNPNLDNPNPNPNPNPDLEPNPNPKLNPNSNPYPNPNPNPNPNCNCNPNCNPNLNLDNPDPNLDLYPNPYHSPYANPNHNPSRNLDLYPNPYHNPNSNPNRNPNRNVDNPNPNPNHNHNHDPNPNPNPNPKRNCNPNYNPNPNSNLENHKSNPNLNSNPNHNPNLENHNNYPNLNLENCNPNANANANPNPNPNSNLNSCVRRVNKVFAGAWLLTMAGLLVLSTRSYIPAKSSTVPTHPIDRSIEFLYNYIAASALLFHSVFVSYGIRGLANRNLLFDHWFYQAQTALFMAIFLVTLVIGIVDFVQRDFYRFCA